MAKKLPDFPARFAVSGTAALALILGDKQLLFAALCVRVVRDGIVIFEGEMASLRRFKDDVKEVAAGYECGMQVEKFNDIKEGDIIEAFTMEEIPR